MMRRRLRGFLLGLIVLLAAALAWQELSGPEPLPAPAPAGDRHWQPPELQPWSLPPLEAFRPVLDRPLFNPDRQPVELAQAAAQDGAEKPAEAEPAPPAEPLDVVLRGVILLPEHRIALLEAGKDRKPMRVREGEPLKGELSQWKLKHLAARSARFEHLDDGREQEVKLQVYNESLPVAPGGKKAGNASRKAAQGKKSASGLDPEEIRRKVAERRARGTG